MLSDGVRDMDRSAEYFRYWDKADPAVEGSSFWHPLVYHCLDVAACGQVFLWHQPAWLENMAVLSGLDPGVLSQWLAFLLAIQDISKCTGRHTEDHFASSMDYEPCFLALSQLRQEQSGPRVETRQDTDCWRTCWMLPR